MNQDSGIHTNLWTPKKISNVPYKKLNDSKCSDASNLCFAPSISFESYFTDDSNLVYEYSDKVVTFNLKPLVVCLLLEIEYSTERLPVIKIESIVTASINDWFNDFNLESSIKLHAFCYNADYKHWEPLIDLYSEDDTNYRPWELAIKVGMPRY